MVTWADLNKQAGAETPTESVTKTWQSLNSSAKTTITGRQRTAVSKNLNKVENPPPPTSNWEALPYLPEAILDTLKDLKGKFVEPIKESGKEFIKKGMESGYLKSGYETQAQLDKIKEKTDAQKVADFISTTVSGANVAFSPISGVTNVTKSLPTTAGLTKIVEKPFEWAGTLGGKVGGGLIDISPLSQQDKETLKPAFEEAGALAAQLFLGKVSGDLYIRNKAKIDTALKTKVEFKIKSKVNAGQQITPTEIKKIAIEAAEETIKEVPVKAIEPLTQEARKINVIKPKIGTKQIGQYKLREGGSNTPYGTPEVFSDVKITKIGEFKGDQWSSNQNIVNKHIEKIKKGEPIDPIIIKNGKIIDGFHRLEALTKLGYKEVPTIFVEENLSSAKKIWAKDYPGSPFNVKDYLETNVSSKYPKISDFYNGKTKKPPIIEKTKIPYTTPIEGTGDIRTRGLSAGVEERAIEKGLTKDLGDLPEYKQVDMKLQAQKALDYINTYPELGFEIMDGKRLPPPDILPSSIFKAMEYKALRMGDVETLRRLATNTFMPEQATLAGQTLSALVNRNPESAVKLIQDIVKIKREVIENRTGSIKKAVEKTINEGSKAAKSHKTTKQSWAEFVTSIRC